VDRDRFFEEWAAALIVERRLDRETAMPFLRTADEDGAATREVFFDRVRLRLGIDEPTDVLVDAYWRDQLGRYKCDEDTIAGLRRMRDLGYKVGIATNGGARQIDKIGAAGLDCVVDGIAVSREVGFAKPDPRLFAAAAKRCGASLEGAWVVGDRPETDIAGAVAIGARSVWISRRLLWAEPRFRPTLSAATAAEAMLLVAAADGLDS